MREQRTRLGDVGQALLLEALVVHQVLDLRRGAVDVGILGSKGAAWFCRDSGGQWVSPVGPPRPWLPAHLEYGDERDDPVVPAG